jgi:antitoxin (DNA-binding transcriptional repressor) of toxin-antitoxin stability system
MGEADVMSPETSRHYASFTDARTHLRDVLDAAESGHTVTLMREGARSAVVSADRLRSFLAESLPSQAQVAHEDGAFVVFLANRPFVSEGATLDEALDDLVVSLREYALDWEDHLGKAPNHSGEWGLVQLINLSTDEQLADWVRAAQ